MTGRVSFFPLEVPLRSNPNFPLKNPFEPLANGGKPLCFGECSRRREFPASSRTEIGYRSFKIEPIRFDPRKQFPCARSAWTANSSMGKI